MTVQGRNEAAELWEEYDNVAYFVGAAYASPQQEARHAELKELILAAERRATVERLREELGPEPTPRTPEDWTAQDERRRTLAILDEEAALP